MNQPINIPFGISPISEELALAIHQLDSKQLQWLSGYCAGFARAEENLLVDNSVKNVSQDIQVEQVEVAVKVLVLFGSQTGNSEAVAKKLESQLSSLSIDLELGSLDDYTPKDLKKWNVILLVVSTHGEGDPPDDAFDFFQQLSNKRAPKLEGVSHAVLALGDSSYEFFCQTGKDFDKKLSELGSKTIFPLVEADLDYEEIEEQWLQQIVEKITEINALQENNNSKFSAPSEIVKESQFNKNNPFSATVICNQQLTGTGSSKTIHHIEISLENSGILYEPGDSVGVWVKNDRALIEQILTLTKLTGEEVITFKEQKKTLSHALRENLELTLINKKSILRYLEKISLISQEKAHQLKSILDNDFSEFVTQNQFIDILLLGNTPLLAQDLVDILPAIKPRVYSIASSLDANPEQLDILISLVQHSNASGERKGVASQYIIESLKEDDEILIYIDANKKFKLPHDDKPIILIGPGTGVAPFRSFIQERVERNAVGKNWLFFGNKNFNTDFLYQTEWLKLKNKGVLTRLNVAFSRDQKEKVYVQDKLLENAKEIWHWIDKEGASFYVCGDLKNMAKDVQQALLTIIEEQGAQSSDEAVDYLKQLRKENRYQRDVY